MATTAPTFFHVFETRAGFAALGWSAHGITRFVLPLATAEAAARQVHRRLPDAAPAAPPPEIAAVAAAAARYFAGEPADFVAARLDLGPQPAFAAEVYDRVRRLAWGETTTYGAIAAALGAGPEAARDVGQAMATNPVPLLIPCHRVLAAGGKLGGFSAPGGAATKRRMLVLEGAVPPEARPEQQAFGF